MCYVYATWVGGGGDTRDIHVDPRGHVVYHLGGDVMQPRDKF